MLFMNGRRLAQLCICTLHKAGYLDGTIRIKDAAAFSHWMLYEMMPIASEEFSEQELSILESDRYYYINVMNNRKNKEASTGWTGDFTHEIMNWFERSYLDGWHYITVHDRFGREYKTKMPNNELFTCPITNEKADSILMSLCSIPDVQKFCWGVLVPSAPALVKCFEKL